MNNGVHLFPRIFIQTHYHGFLCVQEIHKIIVLLLVVWTKFGVLHCGKNVEWVVFENMMFRRIFEAKREDVIGRQKIIARSFIICDVLHRLL